MRDILIFKLKYNFTELIIYKRKINKLQIIIKIIQNTIMIYYLGKKCSFSFFFIDAYIKGTLNIK